MHVLWPVARRQLRLLVHDEGVPMISRAPAHEERRGPVDQGAHGTIRGALVMPVQQIEDRIQFVVSHLEISNGMASRQYRMPNAN